MTLAVSVSPRGINRSFGLYEVAGKIKADSTGLIVCVTEHATYYLLALLP